MSPIYLLYIAWFAWAVAAVLASSRTPPPVARLPFGRQWKFTLMRLAGFWLVFDVYFPGRWNRGLYLWHTNMTADWLLLLLGLVGFALAFWGQRELGRLWSLGVARMKGHRIITDGPYRYLKHPVYVGLVIAAFATAAMRGTVPSFVGVALLAGGWYFKGRLEEEFLAAP